MLPIVAVVLGLIAGTIGTLAMDLLWFIRFKLGGGKGGFLGWEFSAGLNSWENAPAPAQVGKRIYEGFLQRELPTDRAAFTNNFVHWAYGIGWGSAYGIVVGSLPSPNILLGLLFGAVVWVSGYILLPAAGIYKPMREYDVKTLWDDLSAHLVYGLAAAATFAWLATQLDAL